MSHLLKRFIAAMAFALLGAAFAYVSYADRGTGDATEWALLIAIYGAVTGFLFWPIIEGIIKISVRPTVARVIATGGIAILAASTISLVTLVIIGQDAAITEMKVFLIMGTIVAYLIWPRLEQEIDQRRGGLKLG